MMIDIAERRFDNRESLEQMCRGHFVRDPHAAMQLNRLLTDKARGLTNPHLGRRDRATTLVGVTILFFVAYWLLAGPGTFFWLRYRRQATLSWFWFGAVALGSFVAVVMSTYVTIPSIGPPFCPAKTPLSFSSCSSVARSSTNMPRRQLPSVMSFGVSATTATATPLTLVPSISPSAMLKTSVTRQ